MAAELTCVGQDLAIRAIRAPSLSEKVSLDAESAHTDPGSEGRRSANGLLKLEGAGAIKNETDASFYAHLIRAFDAQYLGKVDSKPSKPSGILEHAEAGHG